MDSVVLKNIRYKYPLAKEYALEDINFTFEANQFYGVIGPNGSGKSSLCSLIKGLIPEFYLGEFEGTVEIEGIPINEWDKNKLCTKIGYIFQNPFTQISGIRDSVLEEIVLALENQGMPKEEMIERALEVARLIDIYDIIDKNPNELSGGQRQRVAFASIVAMNADIYVIDEPTSQLDPEGTENVFKIIRSLKKQKKTIILIEHKIDLIAEYADKVLVMSGGHIIRSGPTQEILSDYTLLEQNIAIPQMAIFGRDMKEAGKPLSQIPITLEAAVQRVKERNGVYE